MKQHEISGIIKKRFNNLDRLFHEIIIKFEIEAIHKFRTEIKKLRAFFRLLNTEINKEDELSIAKEIKIFYGYTGSIRNLQLQLKNIDSSLENSAIASADEHIKLLKAEIENQKKKMAEFTDAINFDEEAKKILEKLPANFKKASVKKFIHKKLDELQQLLIHLPDKEALHSIRKILKDILYNWKFIKCFSGLLPAFLSQKKQLKSFTEVLGVFNDRCIGLTFLQTYYPASATGGEKKTLQQLTHKWQTEKEDAEKQIYAQLQLIEFPPVQLWYSINLD